MSEITKEEAIATLSKPLHLGETGHMSDVEIERLLTIPDRFFPENPNNYTSIMLISEQVNRKISSQITPDEIIDEVLKLVTLRFFVTQGDFWEMESLGNDWLRGELAKREKTVRARIERWKAQ